MFIYRWQNNEEYGKYFDFLDVVFGVKIISKNTN